MIRCYKPHAADDLEQGKVSVSVIVLVFFFIFLTKSSKSKVKIQYKNTSILSFSKYKDMVYFLSLTLQHTSYMNLVLTNWNKGSYKDEI